MVLHLRLQLIQIVLGGSQAVLISAELGRVLLDAIEVFPNPLEQMSLPEAFVSRLLCEHTDSEQRHA